MRSLTTTPNPVQQSYGGGDQLNVRDLKNMHDSNVSNFQTVQDAIHLLEERHTRLEHKLRASYEFIDWMRDIHPELMQEYKAHNDVKHVFDKAAHNPGYAAPMAETSA